MARREKLRHFLIVIVLPSLLIIGLFVWFYRVIGPPDPFATRYLSAELVSQSDISSGTGVAFEVTVRFSGLQKSFQTDDPAIIAAFGDNICIEETRGAPVGDDVPRPRFHRLVMPELCQTAAD